MLPPASSRRRSTTPAGRGRYVAGPPPAARPKPPLSVAGTLASPLIFPSPLATPRSVLPRGTGAQLRQDRGRSARWRSRRRSTHRPPRRGFNQRRPAPRPIRVPGRADIAPAPQRIASTSRRADHSRQERECRFARTALYMCSAASERSILLYAGCSSRRCPLAALLAGQTA
jgi:hypothetical protein